MRGEHPAELLMNSLEKEIIMYYYDYEDNKIGYLSDKIYLWNFIFIMRILSKNVMTEKTIAKIENIIRHPKVLVVFVKSLKKIFYVWLKDYDLHCRLIMRLYPDIYNPTRLLKLHGGGRSEFEPNL